MIIFVYLFVTEATAKNVCHGLDRQNRIPSNKRKSKNVVELCSRKSQAAYLQLS